MSDAPELSRALRLAQAISRERCHERTSGVGVSGSTLRSGGQQPNFSLYTPFTS